MRAFLLAAVVAGSAVTTLVAAHRQFRVNVAPLLADAQSQFDHDKMIEAERSCDEILRLLGSPESLDADQRNLLVATLVLRSRARLGKHPSNDQGARDDLKAVLQVSPSYQLKISNRDVAREFSAVKAETVGSLKLQVTPADADVRIDGIVADMRTQSGDIELIARSHTLSVRKPGYRDVATTFDITADVVTPLSISLERLTSTLTITSEPAEVQVFVDDVFKGATQTGISPEGSGVLRIPDIASGFRELKFVKACKVTVHLRQSVPKPDDVVVPLVKLAPAVATVSIKGSGGDMYVDGEPRGPVPLVTDICEGKPLIEVRTDRSRFVTRPDLKAGEAREIQSELRPAVAILAANGVAAGSAGDFRIEVEKELLAATGLTIFAPPLDTVEKEMRQQNLDKGWLAFDATNTPIANYPSATISAPKRREYSEHLAGRLGVQGVAEITVPSTLTPRNILLTLLAAGSGDPEVIPIDLEDLESIQSAIARLSGQPRLVEMSAGVQVADVRDVVGTVVVRQLWGEKDKPYLAAGDIIVAADGHSIKNGGALADYLSTKKVNAPVTLEAKGPGGAVRSVEVRVAAIPLLIGSQDETLLKNKLLLTFRLAQREAETPDEEASASLNLAVALMKFGNWNEARVELEKVTLADRHGVVGYGTVKYLLGECLARLNRAAEADDAFRAARDSKDARLTGDGPPIRELAEAKLNEPRRKR